MTDWVVFVALWTFWSGCLYLACRYWMRTYRNPPDLDRRMRRHLRKFYPEDGTPPT